MKNLDKEGSSKKKIFIYALYYLLFITYYFTK